MRDLRSSNVFDGMSAFDRPTNAGTRAITANDVGKLCRIRADGVDVDGVIVERTPTLITIQVSAGSGQRMLFRRPHADVEMLG